MIPTTLVGEIAADGVMNFVTLDEEQLRQFVNADSRSLSPFRVREKVEVDFVLERAGRVVGLEGKAAASSCTTASASSARVTADSRCLPNNFRPDPKRGRPA